MTTVEVTGPATVESARTSLTDPAEMPTSFDVGYYRSPPLAVRAIETLLRVSKQFFEALILSALIYVSVTAIVELTNRISLGARVDAAITEIARRIAQSSGGPSAVSARAVSGTNAQRDNPPPTPKSAQSPDPASSSLAPSALPPPPLPVLETPQQQLNLLYVAKQVVLQIEASGEQSDGSINSAWINHVIMDQYGQGLGGGYVTEKSALSLISNLLRIWSSQGSELISALLVVSCGGIGAVISGLRRNEFTSFHDLALGIASGFVTYLAIRGGKHVFLLEAQGVSLSINPFGCALSGLLAGLFTDKAYGVISDLVDGLIRRIRAATK